MSVVMHSLKVRIEGLVPLLTHNGRLSNPIDPAAKAIKKITGKKKKTDEDYELIAQLEFLGSLYIGEDGGPCIPGENIEEMLVAAAKRSKQGPSAKMGVVCDGVFPIEYDGPRDPGELWASKRFFFTHPAKVQRVRVQRTRPRFIKWALTFVVQYADDVLNQDEIVDWLTTAGRLIGLGDWRPKYGRFNVASIEALS